MFDDKYLHSMKTTNSTEKSQQIYFKTVEEIISLSWQQNGFMCCTFIIIQEVQNVIFPLSKAYIFYTDFCFPCHSMPNFKSEKKTMLCLWDAKIFCGRPYVQQYAYMTEENLITQLQRWGVLCANQLLFFKVHCPSRMILLPLFVLIS